MGVSVTTISPQHLIELTGTAACPLLFDVRRSEAYAAVEWVIPTARWRDHRAANLWGAALSAGATVVVYCVHGHQVSQSAAALLRSVGVGAGYLEGGIEAYAAAGGPLVRRAALSTLGRSPGDERPSRWVTRERPKIDRIACPWFIRRFIDRDAVIHFVAADWVAEAAVELDAVPFDIPDVAFSHVGELCSFDAFLDRFGIADAALAQLATIVRGADTGRLDLAPQSAGLLALSLGLSVLQRDDQAMLEQGLGCYDALYAWCRFAGAESHGWPPVRSVA
ncbi:MAG: chromate resistance protein ChrB domain-containing protein [Kiloniellales bacterium]